MIEGASGRAGLPSNVLLAAASLAIVTIILAGVGEVAVSFSERHRTSVPGTMPLLYYRHGVLGHALVLSYDCFGWVHVNSDGFHGVSQSVVAAEDALPPSQSSEPRERV